MRQTPSNLKSRSQDPLRVLCEFCGYSLEGLTGQPACPECGEAIELSLPGRRAGSPWQNGPSIAAFLGTNMLVLFHPIRVWSGVRLGGAREAGLLIANLTLGAALPSVALGITMLFPGARGNFAYLPFFFVGAVLLLATMTAIEFLGLPFFAARRGWRVPIDASFVIVAHASAMWTLFGALLGAMWVLFHLAEQWWPLFVGRHIAMGYGIADLMLLIYAIVFVIAIASFSLIAGAGWQALRFANRTPRADGPARV